MAFGIDMDGFTLRFCSQDVSLKQFRKMGEIILCDVIESSRKMVGINHSHFPTGIANVNTAIYWDGDLFPLCCHPCRNFFPLGLEGRGQIVDIGHAITSSSKVMMSPSFLILPPLTMCIASNRPSPSASSDCPLNKGDNVSYFLTSC